MRCLPSVAAAWAAVSIALSAAAVEPPAAAPPEPSKPAPAPPPSARPDAPELGSEDAADLEAAPGEPGAVEAEEEPETEDASPPQEPHLESPAPTDEEEEEPPPEAIPPATDTLGGHFVLGVSVGLDVPVLSLDSGLDQTDSFDAGWTVAADAGLGISRTTVLALSGSFSALSDDADCAGCTGRSLSVGPLLRYHLVQGLRFDPWLAVGVAFRQTSIDDGPTYVGIDWLDLRLGGDWYASGNLGFGPWIGLAVGNTVDRTTDGASAAFGTGTFHGSTYGHLKLGLRVVFDAPGK
jgi:hypothetical protein